MEPEHNALPEITSNGHGAEIAVVVFASLACAVIAYGFGLNNSIQSKKIATLSVEQTTKRVRIIDPFATVSLLAKSAYVFDVKNQKVIFAKNANQVLPLASITKIMTAQVATEMLAQNAIISISKEALQQEGDSGLMANERWNFKKLLDYTLAVSSNDGAAALSLAASASSATSSNFVEKMNEKAGTLGLTSMKFYNETGLDESAVLAGGYGSAADVAKLFANIFNNHPEILSATRYSKFTTSSLDNIKHIAINTDSDIDKIPGVIASKTGFSDLAGGNLAIIYDAGVNYPVAVVVLGSTYDGRFADIALLINATNARLSLQK